VKRNKYNTKPTKESNLSIFSLQQLQEPFTLENIWAWRNRCFKLKWKMALNGESEL